MLIDCFCGTGYQGGALRNGDGDVQLCAAVERLDEIFPEHRLQGGHRVSVAASGLRDQLLQHRPGHLPILPPGDVGATEGNLPYPALPYRTHA